MKRKSYLLVVGVIVGLALAVVTCGFQLNADIYTDETSPVIVAEHGASIYTTSNGCDPNTGYASFTIHLDGDSLNDGCQHLGPMKSI